MNLFRQELIGRQPLSNLSKKETLLSIKKLKEDFKNGLYPFLSIVEKTDDLEFLTKIAMPFQKFKDVVVLGTGGSSLGGRTLVDLKQSSFSKLVGHPRLHFFDNVDPLTLKEFFNYHSLSQTGFIIISKSGSTAETIAQFLVLLDQGESGFNIKNQCIVITEPKQSPLRKLATELEIKILDHDPHIGGRFSVFSLVGLLPAIIAGVKVHKVREGAKSLLNSVFNEAENATFLCDFFSEIDEGLNISSLVMMPYFDRLTTLSFWFRQLWAESLGKEGTGSTPINALGTVDQHSQLQLYLEGPRDKFFTLLFIESCEDDYYFSDTYLKDPDLNYLKGQSLGTLLHMEGEATAQSLVNHQRPIRKIYLQQYNEETLGALMMQLMIETLLMAELLKIDPLSQPAVEESKILTRQYMLAGREQE